MLNFWLQCSQLCSLIFLQVLSVGLLKVSSAQPITLNWIQNSYIIFFKWYQPIYLYLYTILFSGFAYENRPWKRHFPVRRPICAIPPSPSNLCHTSLVVPFVLYFFASCNVIQWSRITQWKFWKCLCMAILWKPWTEEPNYMTHLFQRID